ncbi:MAG: transcriptional regulator [Thalassobius sp.]|nr:transcriptional regulator [Thalassovita sp.]
MITDLSEYIEDLMVPVEGGELEMVEYGESHIIELSNFLMAKYPVTQELYEYVTTKNPSYFRGSTRPIENVNWYDAVEFCNHLSDKLGFETYYNIEKSQRDQNNKNNSDELKWLVTTNEKSNGFRLPTGLEWEYAAKGGIYKSKLEYSGSNTLNTVGWYSDNCHEESKPVGLKKANELGLYDMSGNIYEWCWDWYGTYEKDNLLGAKSGSSRVVRGGSWNYYNTDCRVESRFNYDNPVYKDSGFGFRLSQG